MIDTPAVPLDVAARFAATIERRRLPLAILFAATGTSLLGRQIATIAIPAAVYSATGSLPHSGITATCLIFPWLLTDPAGNAFARRIGHKPTSIAAGILGGAMAAVVPLFHLTASLSLAPLLLIVVLFAYVTALGSASRHALMSEAADLAGRSAEQVRNALRPIAWVAMMAGPLLAGLGIMYLGPDPVVGIAAACIAFAAAADLFLASPATVGPSPGRSRRAGLSATSTQRAAGPLDHP